MTLTGLTPGAAEQIFLTWTTPPPSFSAGQTTYVFNSLFVPVSNVVSLRREAPQNEDIQTSQVPSREVLKPKRAFLGAVPQSTQPKFSKLKSAALT